MNTLRVRLPEYVLVFEGGKISSGSGRVTIKQALGIKFNYTELMGRM